jgi:hypothetical protein
MANDGLLDSSNYPKDHVLHSNRYKAQLGCVKDESCGEVWKQWILLRPKCYSMQSMRGTSHKRAKGIQRVVVGRMSHSDYADVFHTGEMLYRDVRRFKTACHSISTI